MNGEMLFESTMLLYFGDKKAHWIAGQVSNPKYRREWLREVIDKHIMKQIDAMDTTPGHKQQLMATAEAARNAIGRNDQPSWDLVSCLFVFIGRLLGLDRGYKCHTIACFQTPAQHHTEGVLACGDPLHDCHDREDAISLRRELVASLKKEGLSDFKVALVLNTTEYEVKKLRREL